MKTKKTYPLCLMPYALCLLFTFPFITLQTFNSHAQNGGAAINTTGAAADNSAMLDISSTNQGMRIPRVKLLCTTDVTTIQNPVNSLLVFDSIPSGDITTAGFYYWDTTATPDQWRKLLTSGTGWQLTGNSGTTTGTNFIGTTDNKDFVFKTNNTEWARITSGGNVGIGTTSPNYKQVNSFLNTATSSQPSDAAIGLMIANTGNTANMWSGIAFSQSGGTTWTNDAAGIFAQHVGVTPSHRQTDLAFFTVADNAGSATEKIRVLGNGNVGIGTTSPRGPLHVKTTPATFSATGGTITYSDGYTIHTFTTSGTFTPSILGAVEVLVVGGGGGGSAGANGGGPGGAGGVVYNTSVVVTSQQYVVTVGAGGSGSTGAGANGYSSMFSTITAIGGGGGTVASIGSSGGSGSGAPASSNSYTGGSGTTGQGFQGGNNNITNPYPAGGGGGAGAAGANGSSSQSGKGGDGISYSISGSVVVYGGGGGGGGTFQGASPGAGGSGGGGAGSGPTGNATSGTNNTGGGGGGAGNTSGSGGNGGSGIVIIRYPTIPAAIDILVVSSDSKVGIGTTSPVSLLNMEGKGLINELFRISNDINITKDSTLVYTSAGKVGVGTISPVSTLETSKTSGCYWISSNHNWGGTIEPPQAVTITNSKPNGYDPILIGRMTTGTGVSKPAFAIGMVGTQNWGNSNVAEQIGDLYFITRDNADVLQERMRITSTGNIGIGTASPGHLLSLNGGAYCDGTGSWVAGSDSSYKRNIKTMDQYGLEEILNLRPVSYIHKKDKNNKIQLGFIAQEVKLVISELVEGEEGSMGIAYDRIVVVLVNAMKEQQKQIKEQQKFIEKLQFENIEVKAEIKELKTIIKGLSKK
ncbi:MAG: tail fiber domain-containing protein [Bacteroidetes bacterium]|nr:tail fiber domain-containing protein [Bacteroidota bacterium]